MNHIIAKRTAALAFLAVLLLGVMVKCDEPPGDKRFPMVTTSQAVTS